MDWAQEVSFSADHESKNRWRSGDVLGVCGVLPLLPIAAVLDDSDTLVVYGDGSLIEDDLHPLALQLPWDRAVVRILGEDDVMVRTAPYRSPRVSSGTARWANSSKSGLISGS